MVKSSKVGALGEARAGAGKRQIPDHLDRANLDRRARQPWRASRPAAPCTGDGRVDRRVAAVGPIDAARRPTGRPRSRTWAGRSSLDLHAEAPAVARQHFGQHGVETERHPALAPGLVPARRAEHDQSVDRLHRGAASRSLRSARGTCTPSATHGPKGCASRGPAPAEDCDQPSSMKSLPWMTGAERRRQRGSAGLRAAGDRDAHHHLRTGHCRAPHVSCWRATATLCALGGGLIGVEVRRFGVLGPPAEDVAQPVQAGVRAVVAVLHAVDGALFPLDALARRQEAPP